MLSINDGHVAPATNTWPKARRDKTLSYHAKRSHFDVARIIDTVSFSSMASKPRR